MSKLRIHPAVSALAYALQDSENTSKMADLSDRDRETYFRRASLIDEWLHRYGWEITRRQEIDMAGEDLREVLAEVIQLSMPDTADLLRRDLAQSASIRIPRAIEAMRRVAAQVRMETVVWQPIETAPKGGESVLLSKVGVDGSVVGLWAGSAWRVGSHTMAWFETPTHWMPLPEPPRALLNKDGG